MTPTVTIYVASAGNYAVALDRHSAPSTVQTATSLAEALVLVAEAFREHEEARRG